MKITFLWWEDCPSYPEAWRRLQKVLGELQAEAEVERNEIRTEEEAERWHFPGSPTILVDGKDIDPRAPGLPFRLTCRLYFKEDGRPSPVPSEEMIRRAIMNAQRRQN
jgi:hypothetical protein